MGPSLGGFQRPGASSSAGSLSTEEFIQWLLFQGFSRLGLKKLSG